MAILNLRLFLLLPLVSTFVFPAVQYSTYRPVSNQYLMSLTPLSHEIFPSVADLSLVLFPISFHFLFLFFLSNTSIFYLSFFSHFARPKRKKRILSPFPVPSLMSWQALSDYWEIFLRYAYIRLKLNSQICCEMKISWVWNRCTFTFK